MLSVMGPESAHLPTQPTVDSEAAATREAYEQAERGDVMTLTPELMDEMAETGGVPDFVRDPT